MAELTYIDLKQCILEDNDNVADEVRALTRDKKFFLWNIMSSPGSGKTTFILDIIRRLGSRYRFGVIEGDIESTVDALKMQQLGIPSVQLRTGGGCHLDASMVLKALESLPLEDLDVVIVENIGNLVCPAEFDTGAVKNAMILSVPEGDDKPLKYPLMFSICDVVIINKIDVLPYFDFDVEKCKEYIKRRNPNAKVFMICAKTGEGVDEWANWLLSEVKNWRDEK